MQRLLVVHHTPRPAAVRLTTAQHLDAVVNVPGAEVLSYNAAHGIPRWLRRLRFDAVVLHTTYLCLRWHRWFEQHREGSAWLADLDALKIALPQDEYHHAHTLDDWLDDLGVTVVGTVLDDANRDELYPRLASKAAFYEVLTGYVDESAAEAVGSRFRPPGEREFDVVYRARNLPYWLGSHGQLKHVIGEVVEQRAPAHGLRSDISTRPTKVVLGGDWLDLLASARTTIGVESGSSTLDRRGELAEQVDELLEREPDLTFEQLGERMPDGWDDYRFFAISPRHFEAVVTKTAQLLVEGSYSGVLEPGRHYLPIRRDFSNLDEVLEQAKDETLLSELTERAYEEVYLSGRNSFRRLSETIGRMVEEHGEHGNGSKPGLGTARRMAAAQGELGRLVLEPAANVARVGREHPAELVAATRLILTESRLRRLLLDYARSTQARENISPRVVLADLFCLAAIQRSSDFEVSTTVDREEHRVVLTSVEQNGGPGPTPQELERLLENGAWEFLLDPSRIGSTIEYPLAGSRTLTLELPVGLRPMPTLSWVARRRPDHVAAALSGLLPRS